MHSRFYFDCTTLSPDVEGRFLRDVFTPVPNMKSKPGGFSDVHICYRGENMADMVAVKRMRNFSATDDKATLVENALKKEISLLMLCQHPNLLEFLGLTRADNGGDLGIVLVYAEKGTLSNYLESPDLDRIGTLRGLAAGLAYLHTPRVHPASGDTVVVVHGDIHMENVLIKQDGTPVLADFGLCKIAETDGQTSLSVRPEGMASGILKYIAPEVHILEDVQEGFERAIQPEVADQGVYTARRSVKSDVFAFGMLAFEVFGGDVSAIEPKAKAKKKNIGLSMQTIVRLIEGKRPKSTDITRSDFPERYWRIIEECWQGRAALRPEIASVLTRL